jgi:transmembrane sensor
VCRARGGALADAVAWRRARCRGRRALERWRARHPHNEAAWQRAELVSRTFGMLPPSLAMPVLDRPAGAERRAALKTLAMLIVAGPAGWVLFKAAPWQQWRADMRTATGEISHQMLADGSRLSLNTDSAVDIAYGDHLRLLHLRAGEIQVASAPDPHRPPRPLVVRTACGSVRAIGTRFIVCQQDQLFDARTQVAVLEGAVELRPAETPAAALIVAAGQQASFDTGSVDAPQALARHADAWVRGLLYADETPLVQILAQLARYRHGVVRCDPAVARLRVTGVYQLRNTDDTDRLLALLQASLPIRIARRSRFWVSVEAI